MSLAVNTLASSHYIVWFCKLFMFGLHKNQNLPESFILSKIDSCELFTTSTMLFSFQVPLHVRIIQSKHLEYKSKMIQWPCTSRIHSSSLSLVWKMNFHKIKLHFDFSIEWSFWCCVVGNVHISLSVLWV